MTTVLKKPKKKQRVVKGAYVDINSVTDKPGNHYCEWIRIVKGHLKEREWKILEIITTEIELVLNMKKDSNNNNDLDFIIKGDIINNAIKQLYERIDEWNGLNLGKTKASLTRYRDYYDISKSWWDQTKRELLGTIFWIFVFKQIEKFVHCSKQRILNIMRVILTAKITYNNTRPVPLINAVSIVCSEEIHSFLLNLDDRLKMNEWIITQKINGNGQTKPRKIITQLQSELIQITNTNTNNPNNNANNNDNNNDSINNRGSISLITSLPQNDNNAAIESITYEGHHKATYSVLDLRYAPTHKQHK